MAVTLNNWSFLDPQLMAKQINAAHPNAISKHALHDPRRMESEINVIAGHDIFLNAKRPLLDCTYWTPQKLAAAIG